MTMWYSLEFKGKCAFIDELFIREGYRGKGIGTRALAFLKENARVMGVKALRLEVERKNADALQLYRKAGFVIENRDLLTVRLAEEKYLA
jgi:GNAT superfamily N-acetyltransferase